MQAIDIELKVGNLVFAKHSTAINHEGEHGICVGVYEIGGRAGYDIIFERGGYDGFSPDEVELILIKTGFLQQYSRYCFTNVMQLDKDYKNGYFKDAFKQAKENSLR